MQIKLDKTSSGWQAETTIDLDRHRVLVILSARSQGQATMLVTRATVYARGEGGAMVHDPGTESRLGDFDQVVAYRRFERLTEKAVHVHHDQVLAKLSTIRVRIEQHDLQGAPLSHAACREELGACHV